MRRNPKLVLRRLLEGVSGGGIGSRILRNTLNEMTILIQDGFDVTHIRVQREGCEGVLTQGQKEHVSETALDGVIADYTLENNGTIADLAREVLVMMNEYCHKESEV